MILHLGDNVSTLSMAIITRVLSVSDPPLSLGICATIYIDLKLMLCVGLARIYELPTCPACPGRNSVAPGCRLRFHASTAKYMRVIKKKRTQDYFPKKKYYTTLEIQAPPQPEEDYKRISYFKWVLSSSLSLSSW